MKDDNLIQLQEQVDAALDIIATIGERSYKPEYLDQISRWQKIGIGLTYGDANGPNVIAAAYEFLEDCNYHNACAVLDWIFPHRHPREGVHEGDLERLQKTISKPNVKVYKYDNERRGIVTRHAKVTVSVKWLDEWENWKEED